MVEMSLKKHPFNFNFGNREKLHEAKSGEYGGDSIHRLDFEKKFNEQSVMCDSVHYRATENQVPGSRYSGRIRRIVAFLKLAFLHDYHLLTSLCLPINVYGTEKYLLYSNNHHRTLATLTRIFLMHFYQILREI